MWNASKPTKKMPSHKPQPKLWAYNSEDKICMTEVRPNNKQERASPVNYKQYESEETKSSKIVISKKQIKYSRNKEPLDIRTDTKDKALNTFQPNLNAIPTVSIFNLISSQKKW